MLLLWSYPNIRRKLKKNGGILSSYQHQAIEIADKVFVNWDQEAIKEAEKTQKENDKRFIKRYLSWPLCWAVQIPVNSQLSHPSKTLGNQAPERPFSKTSVLDVVGLGTGKMIAP